MTRTAYPSDLTDGEWKVLELLVPSAKPGGRPRSADMREVLNGVFYILRSGCAWRLMPHDLPKWKTVYDYFRAWRLEGVWEQLNQNLREQLRLKVGRNAQPSAGVLDSQSVKTTEVGGLRGYDGGKKVKGRRRHVLVDTQGLLLKVKVQAGNVSDREGGKVLLLALTGLFARLTHLFVDGGYKGKWVEWVKETLDWTVEVVQHPTPVEAAFGYPKDRSLRPSSLRRLRATAPFRPYPDAGSSSGRSPGFAAPGGTARTTSICPRRVRRLSTPP